MRKRDRVREIVTKGEREYERKQEVGRLRNSSIKASSNSGSLLF